VNLAFSSRVPLEFRADLEDLLFFNPRQHRVRDGILHSLQEFGHPRVEVAGGELVVRVGTQEAQTLFAYDRPLRGDKLVGAVVFLRTSPEEMAILHVAVHPDYALRGQQAGVGLGVALVEKVKEIATRIVGVRRIIFFYRQEVVIRL
jgi:hypothetical protein